MIMSPAISGEQTYFGRDLEAMSFASNYYRWMLSLFQKYIGRNILEVGAGSGNFSEFLLESKPQQLVCLEPSENMYPLLAERIGHHSNAQARQTFLCDAAAGLEASQDTVFYVNVLEHVEDDALELKLALQTLRPGGHLLIFVPALPFLFGTADENFGHFRRYTKSTLQSLLAHLPAKIVECRYFDFAGILPWWLSFVVLRQQSLSPGMVKLYDRRVVPVARFLESLVLPPFGKNLLLVARKI
jgi:SAM-dependent methyltransferase